MQETERTWLREWLISNGADPGWQYLVGTVDSLEAALQARDAEVANAALVQAFDDCAIWLGRRYPTMNVSWPEVPAGLS